MMKQLVLVANISILGLGSLLSSRSVAEPPAHANEERVCPQPSSPGIKACHARRLLDHPQSMAAASGAVSPLVAPAGFGPADLQAAYNLTASSASAGTGRTIAIVVAQDGPTVEADLAVYRSTFGLPPCTTANGCFQKINQIGATSPLPTADTDWASEMNLNLDMISAVCPNCNIVLVEANSPTDANLGAAVNTAALQSGVAAISNPYGGSESSPDPQTCSTYYQHPGIAVVASAGDAGYGALEFPATCPYVSAVGGTSLVNSPAAARGWTETVWGSLGNSNGGTASGCSVYITKPSWQTDVGCTKRNENDVAIVGDPNTGVAVYDQGSWIVYGGTSVGAGLISAVYGLASAAAPGEYPVSYAYGNPGALFDITQGTNGQCGGSLLYECNAGVGYDGPSGLGSPNGVAAFGPAVPTSDFSLSAEPSSLSVTQGASGSSTIATTIDSGTAQTINLSVAGLPAGATANFASATITAGGSTTITVNSGTAAVGTYSLTVSALGTSATHSTALTLIVTSPPDFSITVNPSSLTIVQGGSSSTTITTTVISGSAQSVSLTVLGLPTGASATFSPSTITAGGGATLAINAGTAVPGSYTLTVAGNGASATHATTVYLTIAAPPADFTLAVSASTQTKRPGSIGFVVITVTGIQGFDAAVNLSVSGFPSKISGIVLPNSVTGSGSSYLIYVVGPRQPTGSFPITVTGISGSLSHSVGVKVNVQ